MGTYDVNQLSGFVFTVAYAGIWLLMVLLWPRTTLHKLALAVVFTMWLVAARWALATVWPGLLGERVSLSTTVVNLAATLAGVAFCVVAWLEYVRDGRRE